MMKGKSMEVDIETILKRSFDENVNISQRAYDNMWEVFQPHILIEDEGAIAFYETIAVVPSKKIALEVKEFMRILGDHNTPKKLSEFINEKINENLP